jgi:hypothetical protein
MDSAISQCKLRSSGWMRELPGSAARLEGKFIVELLMVDADQHSAPQLAASLRDRKEWIRVCKAA